MLNSTNRLMKNCFFLTLLCALHFLVWTSLAFGVDYSWIKGSDGNWSENASWSPNGIPNGESDTATVDPSSTDVTVTMSDSDYYLVGFTVGSGDVVTIEPISSILRLGVGFSDNGGTINNNGIIQLGSSDSTGFVSLTASGEVTLTGSGIIELGNAGYAYLESDLDVMDSKFVNSAGHTIQGMGNIYAAVTNDGIIAAKNGTLTIFGAVSGIGTVQIEDNATLDIQMDLGAGNFIMAALGTLQVADSKQINLSGNYTFSQTAESSWSWGSGSSLKMSGSGGQAQTLEVGGSDLGAVTAGFTGNFSLPGLVLDGQNTVVTLVDNIDNGNRASPEALYVESLQVNTGTILYLNGIHLYTHDGSTPVQVVAGDDRFGSGSIRSIPLGNYYVNIQTGNDANDGSAASPWKTLHHAIAMINGGSAGFYTLNVVPGGGAFPSYSYASGEADAALIISQDNVTIVGQSGSTVIVDGTGTEIWSNGFEITGSNVTMKNLSITNFAYGVKIDGASPEIAGNKLYDNTNNIGITAAIGNTASPIIKNNEIYEVGSDKVHFGIYIGGNAGSTVIPEIYHNTLDGGQYDGILIEGDADAPTIKYNIITNFRQYGIENSDPTVQPTLDYNDVWQNSTKNYNDDCTPGAHDISQDPNYTNPGQADYSLSGDSPCINAIPTGAGDPVEEDIVNTARPYGSGYDMGAYENTTLPAVTTNAVTAPTANTATGNGNITNLGSSNATHHGVCWNTTGKPTIAGDNKDIGATSTTGSFTAPMTGLAAGTTYYVRAFATNSAGTGYGSQVSFSTSASATQVNLTGPASVNAGAVSTAFTLTSQDATGNAANVTQDTVFSLTSNTSGTATFYSDATGSNVITQVTIANGTSATTFYYKDTAAGTPTVTATRTSGMNLGSDTHQLTVSSNVSPGTYYVDAVNGNDANDGSADHPWKTLHHALAQINGGSAGTYVLWIALGSYSVSNTSSGEADEPLQLTQSNTTLIGQKGSAPLIDGTGAQNWTKGLEITGWDVVVENLDVTGFSDTDEEGIRISGGTGNEIRYCRIYGNNWGVRVDSASQTTIRNCEFYENVTHGIDDVQSSGTVMVRNKLHDNTLYAIRTESDSEIKRNLIYDNTFGIRVEVVNGSTISPTIQNNVIYQATSNTMSYGIHVLAQNGSTANPMIYHNTIDGGYLTGIYLQDDASYSSPVIRYNIITNFAQHGILNSGMFPSVTYNDSWNNTAGNYSGMEGVPGTNISEDPLYGSYALQADSPCINKIPATEGDPVNLDYPGYIRPRPDETAKDMGAYEYVGSTSWPYILPGGTGQFTDYRMFTVPFYMTGADMLATMETTLGPYDPGLWRGFAYVGGVNLEFNGDDFKALSNTPGTGFWIISLRTDTIPYAGKIAPDGVNFEKTLSPGWHQIGLPWVSENIGLGSIKVTDGVNTWSITSAQNNLTQRLIWDYTGIGPYNGYERRDVSSFVLQCGTGYFLKVVAGENVTLIIPPQSDARSRTEERGSEGGEEEPPPPPGGGTHDDGGCPEFVNGILEGNVTFPTDKECNYSGSPFYKLGPGVNIPAGATVTLKPQTAP